MKAMVYVRFANAEIVITGIEAESLGGAEHKILDRFHNVDNALADVQGHSTEYFNGLMENARVMSIEEFAVRYEARQAKLQYEVNERLEWIDEQKAEIKKLEEQIANIKNNIEYTEDEIGELVEMGAQRRYTAAEKIEEALNKLEAIKAIA